MKPPAAASVTSSFKPAVSVVIPSYNRADMLVKCVESVLASEGVEVEAVVADDCSTDDTAAKVSARFGGDRRVKYVRTGKNLLTAGARNRGAQAATGEYLMFLDNDNELDKNAIGELLACFARNRKVLLAGPISVNWRGEDDHPVWTLGCGYDPWTSRVVEYYPGGVQSGSLPPAPDGGCDYPTTYIPNAFMLRRETFLSVGGFDESYLMQYEEADFGLRVTGGRKELGAICSKAVTRHHGYLDPAEVGCLRALGIGNPRRAYCFGRNRVKFARRHFAWYQALVVAFVFAPLSAIWYGTVAIRNRRADIARAYLKGTVRGIFGLA